FGTLTLAAPAFAQTCLVETYGKNVQCTANDVRIAAVTSTHNLDGTPIATCNIGDRISFVATAQLVVGSTSSRSNIGMYFAKDNQPGDGGKAGGGALTGSCFRDIIPPGHPSLNAFCTGPGTPFSFCTGNQAGTSTQTLGSSNYTELDNLNLAPTPDNCGDGNAGTTQTIDVLVQDVLCEPISLTNPKLRLPNCVSWQVPGSTTLCQSPSPTYPFQSTAVPGSPSKCNCGVLEVPIIVQRAAIDVSKVANPTTQSGTDGGPVNYTVVVTNKSNLGAVTVNQLCDDKYGNIATATTSPAQPACAAGSLCASPNNVAGSTCATSISCSLPATLANPNDTVTCTFTGQIPENSTITDTVTANAVDQQASPLSKTATATASAGDAPSTATLTKTFVGTTAGCATVRYQAKVHNSSGGDETLTLSAVGDNAFGSITSLHGDSHTNNSVVGTTCGVATGTPGSGTLSGSTGGGAFNQTLAVGGSDYSCQFDGVICSSPLTTITLPNGATCTGIQHSNALTATLAGDDGTGETVSQSGGSLTVFECFDATSQ
ncbi:MAG: hypothetical protein DMG27_16390, partial [Acidobacteria bacterium]